MSDALRILHLASDAADRDRCRAALHAVDHSVVVRAVANLDDFATNLSQHQPDLVLCALSAQDQFAMRALVMTRLHFLDLPFVVVDCSGGDTQLRERAQQAATAVVAIDDPRIFAQQVLEIGHAAARADQASLLLRALEQSPASIVLTDRRGRITYVNQRFCETSGYGAEEVLGLNPGLVKSGVTPDALYGDMWATISRGGEYDCEIQNRKKSGELYWEHMRISGIVDPATGDVTHYLAIKIDISDRKAAEFALLESEARFRLLAENASDVICRLTPSGEILYASPSCETVLGRDAEQVVGRSFFELVVLDDPASAGESFSAQAGLGEPFNLEHTFIKPGGEAIWIESSFKSARVEGQLAEVHATVREITKRKRAFDMLHYNAYNDKHTGLPNRLFFLECLTRAVERHRACDTFQFAVLLLDIDQFKVINESLGHRVGDTLLRQVGRLLKRHMRGADTLAYLTGDEFAILLEEIADTESVVGFAERLQQLFITPFRVDDADVFVSVSVGVVFCDATFDQADHYLRSADTAMYKAKSQGKSRLKVFESPMHEQAMRRFSMQTDLRRSLERNELRLVYQPIFRLDNREIIGFEALLRWQHPERGTVSPMEFISLAEETELIVPIGEWVLIEACQQLKNLQQRYQRPMSINVNASSIQFLDPNFAAMVCKLVERLEIAPGCLKIEITESLLMQHSEQLNHSIATLNRCGVKLVMDDFGTGFSSLSYLQQFPIDAIKIDRGFVMRLDAGPQAEAIVKTIISLARNFGMSVVAEGIETEAQLQLVLTHGCEIGQGYHLARPMTLEALHLLMETSPPASTAALI